MVGGAEVGTQRIHVGRDICSHPSREKIRRYEVGLVNTILKLLIFATSHADFKSTQGPRAAQQRGLVLCWPHRYRQYVTIMQ